jgi:hypothetical protein
MKKRVLVSCAVLVLLAGGGSLARIVGHAWVAFAGISSAAPHAADRDGFSQGNRPAYDSGYERSTEN